MDRLAGAILGRSSGGQWRITAEDRGERKALKEDQLARRCREEGLEGKTLA